MQSSRAFSARASRAALTREAAPGTSQVSYGSRYLSPEALVHPFFRQLPPPLILIGMHRSGTSLVAGLLSRLGAYLGPDSRVPDGGPDDAELVRIGYGEAGVFRSWNDRLLTRTGSSWDRPEGFLEAPTRNGASGEAHRLALATHRSLLKQYAAPITSQPPAVWGWKDPRNSLTLPIWLQLFPEARVIHIRREPADAARSLHRRALDEQAEGLTMGPLALRERLLWWLRHPVQAGQRAARRLTGSVNPPPERAATGYEHCLALANTYTAVCESHRPLARHWLEVDYRGVVRNPGAACEKLADYCGLSISRSVVSHAAALVQPRSAHGRS